MVGEAPERIARVVNQATLDRWFPLGANVTVFDSQPEDEDASQFICPRLMIESEDPLILRAAAPEKVCYIEVDRIEDYDSSDRLFTDKLVWQADPEMGWRLTDRISPAARTWAAQTRKDAPWLFDEVAG